MADDLVVRLILNIGEFTTQLDRAKAKLEELDKKQLNDKKLRINIDVDDSVARARLEELDAEHKKKTIGVDVDDAEARARLAEDTKPEEKVIHVRTEGDLRTASILTALPMLTPLLATATAGVMGLASAFASAAVGVGGFAAVAVPTLKNIFDATKNAQKAQEEYNKATTNKERQAALKKEQEAWAGLDAQERQAARALMSFQSFWAGFRKSFETPVLNMFTNGLKMLQQLLTDLRPVINAAGQALTQLEKEAAKALGSPFWRQFFNYLGGTARQSIVTFGEAIGNLIKGFAALLMAFRPLSTDMANGLLRLSQRFAEWATHLSSSRGFHQFIQYVRQNGPLVIQIIGQLASIIGKLIVASAPLGHEMLQITLTILRFVNQLLTTHPQLARLIVEATTLTGIVKLLGAGWSSISPILDTVSNGFDKLSKIINILRTSGLTGLITHLRSISPAFNGLIRLFTGFGRIIPTIVSGISRGFTLLGTVIRVFATGAIAALRAFFMVLMTNPVTAVVTIIIAAIAMVTIYIITHWRQVSQFLSQTWRSISTTARTIWNGIVNFIRSLWNGFTNWMRSAAHAVANVVVSAFQWMYNHNYYFKNLVDLIRSAWNTIRSITSSVWHGISSFLSSTWSHISSFMRSHASTIRSMITSTWHAISSVSSSTWGRISSFLSSTWSHITSYMRSHASTIRSMITSTWNAISSVSSSTWGRIVSIVSNGASRIGSILSSLASRAFAWGRNLVHEFASGISSMVGSVISAASNVAHAVARFLGFHSPAEEGPGADADTWAPNLMKMFAQGIEEYTPMVQAALARAITPPQVMVNPQVRGMISGMAQAYSMSASGSAQSNHFIQNGPLIHIENLHVRNEQDIQKLQQAFYNANQRVLRAMGVRQV